MGWVARQVGTKLLVSALVVGVFAIAAAGAAGGGAGASYKPCKGVKDAGPTGSDPADIKGLRARAVSCRTARYVAKRSLRHFGNEIGQDGSVRFNGWRCYSRIGTVNGVPREKDRCLKGERKRVKFYLG